MLALSLELVFEMLQKGVIEILAAQMSIPSRGLDGEYTTADIEEGNIESASAKIKDQHVFFSLRLTVEAVSDGSSSWLVNDTENIKTCNCTGILGG